MKQTILIKRPEFGSKVRIYAAAQHFTFTPATATRVVRIVPTVCAVVKIYTRVVCVQ